MIQSISYLHNSSCVLTRGKAGMGKVMSTVIGFSLLCLASQSMAQVGENFYEMDKMRGERSVEIISESFNRGGSALEGAGEISFGYGVSDNWYTQISGDASRVRGNGTEFEGASWQNIFKLTQLDRLPVGIGFVAEISRLWEREEGYQLTLGPLFQKDVGQVRVNANILFRKAYLDDDTQPTELGYQWQAKYPLRPTLAVGAQGFGEMGEWNDWAPRSEQSHRFGPAIFGSYALAGKQEIKYSASYLSDFSDRARSHGFRFTAEYKF